MLDDFKRKISERIKKTLYISVVKKFVPFEVVSAL